MHTYQVITNAKDHEHEIYEIKADNFQEGTSLHTFLQGGHDVAWFQASQVVGIIDKESQKQG